MSRGHLPVPLDAQKVVDKSSVEDSQHAEEEGLRNDPEQCLGIAAAGEYVNSKRVCEQHDRVHSGRRLTEFRSVYQLPVYACSFGKCFLTEPFPLARLPQVAPEGTPPPRQPGVAWGGGHAPTLVRVPSDCCPNYGSIGSAYWHSKKV